MPFSISSRNELITIPLRKFCEQFLYSAISTPGPPTLAKKMSNHPKHQYGPLNGGGVWLNGVLRKLLSTLDQMAHSSRLLKVSCCRLHKHASLFMHHAKGDVIYSLNLMAHSSSFWSSLLSFNSARRSSFPSRPMSILLTFAMWTILHHTNSVIILFAT